MFALIFILAFCACKDSQNSQTPKDDVPTPPAQIVPSPTSEPSPVVEVPTPIPEPEPASPPECVISEDCGDSNVCTEGKCVAAETPTPEPAPICSDPDVTAPSDNAQLFNKSTTAYSNNNVTNNVEDGCVTIDGKTYLMEGTCNNNEYQSLQYDCSEFNLEAGADFVCQNGACVNNGCVDYDGDLYGVGNGCFGKDIDDADKTTNLWFMGPMVKTPMLIDYAFAPYDSKGHVNTELLLKKESDLNTNTFAHLIWQSVNDWGDLKGSFLPLSKDIGLASIAYLVPPAESPPFTGYYSEPYKVDYEAWGEAIGKEAQKYPLLKYWAIDDFFNAINNSDVQPQFTPEYVCKFVHAARKFSPDIKFYTIAYYWLQEELFDPKLYQDCIDGLIYAYREPSSNRVIKELTNLSYYRQGGINLEFKLPNDQFAEPKEFAKYTITVIPNKKRKRSLNFLYQDYYNHNLQQNYNILFARVKVNDKVVWSKDVGVLEEKTKVYKDDDYYPIALDLTKITEPGVEAKVDFEFYIAKHISNWKFFMKFWGVNFEGFEDIKTNDIAYSENNPKFEGKIAQFDPWPDLELIFAVYGTEQNFFYTTPDKKECYPDAVYVEVDKGCYPSPEYVGNVMDKAKEAWKSGLIQGMFSYGICKKETGCKKNENEIYKMVKEKFGNWM